MLLSFGCCLISTVNLWKKYILEAKTLPVKLFLFFEYYFQFESRHPKVLNSNFTYKAISAQKTFQSINYLPFFFLQKIKQYTFWEKLSQDQNTNIHTHRLFSPLFYLIVFFSCKSERENPWDNWTGPFKLFWSQPIESNNNQSLFEQIILMGCSWPD